MKAVGTDFICWTGLIFQAFELRLEDIVYNAELDKAFDIY